MSNAADGIIVNSHHHPLTFKNSDEKGHSGGWYCNVCNNSNPRTKDSFNCKPCDFDICDTCIFKEIDQYAKNKKN